MSYGSLGPGIDVPVELASSSDRSSSSSSSSKAPSSAAASFSSVLLTSKSSSYSPSDSDVITKRRGVWDDEAGPVCVWPSVGMSGGGLP